MTEFSSEDILNGLKSKFPALEIPFAETYGMLTIEVPRENIIEVLRHLKDDPEMGYSFLTDLCGIHIPADVEKEMGVIYHLHNWQSNRRIRVKTFFKIGDPSVDSATVLWSGANWMERETYDFYGITFNGHPNMTRILNVDDMDYFPMRKQYHLEDATREDKEDKFFGR